MATRKKPQSLDTWEELPASLIFHRARLYVEESATSSANFIPGLSVALSMGVFEALPNSSGILRANCHHDICKKTEMKFALTEFGGRKFTNSFRTWKGMSAFHMEGAELLVIFFTFMELWALDVGLTFQYRTDTMYGEFMHNSSGGPKLWE